MLSLSPRIIASARQSHLTSSYSVAYCMSDCKSAAASVCLCVNADFQGQLRPWCSSALVIGVMSLGGLISLFEPRRIFETASPSVFDYEGSYI